MAALYAVLLHIAVWLAFGAVYLLTPEGGSHTAVLVVPACVMVIGLIVFAVIQSAMPEKLTFYASVLLAHVLLALFLSSCEELLVGGLQALKGISPPAESSGGNEYSTGFYFTFNWLNLTLGAGGMQFLLAVIFVVRDALRAAMGYIPKKKKS
jgi:hypothetical protein